MDAPRAPAITTPVNRFAFFMCVLPRSSTPVMMIVALGRGADNRADTRARRATDQCSLQSPAKQRPDYGAASASNQSALPGTNAAAVVMMPLLVFARITPIIPLLHLGV